MHCTLLQSRGIGRRDGKVGKNTTLTRPPPVRLVVSIDPMSKRSRLNLLQHFGSSPEHVCTVFRNGVSFVATEMSSTFSSSKFKPPTPRSMMTLTSRSWRPISSTIHSYEVRRSFERNPSVLQSDRMNFMRYGVRCPFKVTTSSRSTEDRRLRGFCLAEQRAAGSHAHTVSGRNRSGWRGSLLCSRHDDPNNGPRLRKTP